MKHFRSTTQVVSWEGKEEGFMVRRRNHLGIDTGWLTPKGGFSKSSARAIVYPTAEAALATAKAKSMKDFTIVENRIDQMGGCLHQPRVDSVQCNGSILCRICGAILIP